MPALDLSQFIQTQKDGITRAAFQQLVDAINNLGNHIGADPVGNSVAPSTIQSIDAKTAGEMLHISIQDNNPIQKNIQYFTEVDTDPSFPQPIVFHHGTSRTPPPFPLPAKNDSNEAVTYYVRSYSQYHGSPPSTPVNFGGITPSAVSPSGSTQLTLLPSTGSGTAAPNGQQGGYGLGRTMTRGPVKPKRSVAS